MQLMDKKVERIIIEVTPEMRERIRKLNEQAMKDSEYLSKINQATGNMQAESMAAANRLDNIARYGTDDFVSEKGYTKKMRLKK
jgi:hypothetical protein